ncbi:MAG: hypothetical protein H6601_06745 [Flavobacteriales bacterium]|nr:hypothetical protein [Flavobacteriales bacterium]
MKKKEIIEQVTEILKNNGKLTPAEILERINGELPMVQVSAALKTMLDDRIINVEELGKTKFYSFNTKASNPTAEKPASKRDTTKYDFEGLQQLSKGRLALAIVKRYCLEKKPTQIELKEIFPDKIVPPYGMIRSLHEAKEASKERKRFFINDEDVITLTDGGKVCVSNQFTTNRITKVIDICEKELSLKVKPSK